MIRKIMQFFRDNRLCHGAQESFFRENRITHFIGLDKVRDEDAWTAYICETSDASKDECF